MTRKTYLTNFVQESFKILQGNALFLQMSYKILQIITNHVGFLQAIFFNNLVRFLQEILCQQEVVKDLRSMHE